MRTVVKTYKFQLYKSKKNKHLDDGINIAAAIWNYCIAMTNNISVTSYRTRRRHSAELEFTRKVRRIKCNKEYNAYQVISKIHLVGVLC